MKKHLAFGVKFNIRDSEENSVVLAVKMSSRFLLIQMQTSILRYVILFAHFTH